VPYEISDPQLLSISPALLRLFSLVTLFAHRRGACLPAVVRRAAWYDTRLPTFSDILALACKELWDCAAFRGPHSEADNVQVPRAFMERLSDALCYAA
jgi:hypothetical protein